MSSPKTEFINTMVKAGAGAGKTYGLIHKIVDLVREYSFQNGGQLPRFVVTTFTRKATQEVRERLLQKALEIRGNDPEFSDLFLKFLQSSGQLSVSTIHGVLNQFLRQYGALIGLDTNFTLTKNAQMLRSTILHKMLIEIPEIEALVTHIGWHRLSTFLKEHHRALMFNPQIAPLPEVSFTDYWQKQMTVLKQSIGEIKPFIEAMTLKSKADSLRRFSLSLSEIEKILQGSRDPWTTLGSLKIAHQDYPKNMGSMSNWDEVAKHLRKAISAILTELVEDPLGDRRCFDSYQETIKNLSKIAPEFSQRWLSQKIQLAELELEDLETLTLYILRNFPEKTQAFSESWNYWFIDEYQDTSPIQVEILNRLIGTCPHYVVGDPQQSIYFFRGARSKVFHEKLNSFAASGARIEHKNINRRSQTPVLSFINDLMDLVNKHQFTRMESISEKNSENKLAGHFYLCPEDSELHLEAVAKVVETLLVRNIAPKDIAILCRENSELRELMDHFEKRGLPAQITSQGRFLEDRGVRDALCLWQFLINPFNNNNLIELLRSPWFRVEDDLLLKCAQETKSTIWERLRDEEHATIVVLKSALNETATEGHLEAWQKVLFASSAFTEAYLLDPSGRKEGNLWKLVHEINDLVRAGRLDYAHPLDLSVDTDSNNEEEAPAIRETNQIQLMTIHASKGLEFDHVVIPFLNHQRRRDSSGFWSSDLEDNYWSVPYIEATSQGSHTNFFMRSTNDEVNSLLEEESDRLFYVAVTRAKKSLHFFPPDEGQELSPTGWARHLTHFLLMGPGTFESEDKAYDFKIEKASELAHNPYLKQTFTHSSTLLTPLSFEANTPQQTTSVTNLLRKEGVNAKDGELKWDLEAISKGVFTHRLFEAYASSLGTINLPEELQTFIAQSEVPFDSIIKNGRAEWPFSVPTKTGHLEGKIDLWGRDSEGQPWIIDFKTGSPQFKNEAFEQARIYASALRATHEIEAGESIKIAICYPFKQISFIELCPSEQNLTEESIND